MKAQNYEGRYSENNFWRKLKRFALKAGKEIVEKTLILFYTMQEPQVPLWAKTVVVSALGYFICPFDAIPDFIPIVGYSDDLAVLGAALVTISQYITPEIKEKAQNIVHKWFGRDELGDAT